MRQISVMLNDILYQVKYGLYFLYAFITVLYVVILAFVPAEYKNMAASVILLTDPAALGFFFIGGIWLLEKDEGVHKFYSISPLRPMEYCLAKMASMGIISTLSGVLIAVLAVPVDTNFLLLAVGMFFGSGFFTLLGLLFSAYAKSVNHYMIINILPETVMIVPAVLTAFGITYPLFELFPATMLWHVIELSIKGEAINILYIPGLLLWLCIALFIANYRVTAALQSEGGGKNETNNPAF